MMHVCLFLGQFFFQDEPYGLSFINLRSPPDASEQQEEAAVSTGLGGGGGGAVEEGEVVGVLHQHYVAWTIKLILNFVLSPPSLFK